MGGEEDSQAQQELEYEIQENRAEVARQRKELREREFEIIKSQGEPNWNPAAPFNKGAPQPSLEDIATSVMKNLRR